MLVLHFYDDFCFLGLSTEKCNKCIPLCVPRWVYAWTPAKKQFMRPVGVYTGAQFDRSNLLSKGHVVVSPKLGRCQALAGMIAEAREANRLTPAEASKLRGKSEYLSGQFMGRARKGCHQALAARQYHDKHVHLTPRLRGALDFLELAVGIVPFRRVEFRRGKRPLLYVWTDAMFEPGSPIGLGCIVSGASLKRPVALYATVQESLRSQLKPRETYI